MGFSLPASDGKITPLPADFHLNLYRLKRQCIDWYAYAAAEGELMNSEKREVYCFVSHFGGKKCRVTFTVYEVKGEGA